MKTENDFNTEQTVSLTADGDGIAESTESRAANDGFAALPCGKSAGERNAVEEKKVSVYGKFDTLEQLIKGYANLEAEFTKRCQKLKELEKRSEEKALSAAEQERIIEERLADARFVSERIAADERISDLIISRYLSSMHRAGSAPVLNGTLGQSVLTPIKKPKSLEEAKRLADILLKN